MSKVKAARSSGRFGRSERRALRAVAAVTRATERELAAAERAEARRQRHAGLEERRALVEQEHAAVAWVAARWEMIEAALGRGVAVSVILEKLAQTPRPGGLGETDAERRLDDAVSLSCALREMETMADARRGRNVRYVDGVIETLEAVVYGVADAGVDVAVTGMPCAEFTVAGGACHG